MKKEHIHIDTEKAPQDFSIHKKKLENLTKKLLALCHLENWELSLVIVGSHEIKQLNHEYRNKNSSTDVLSFPLQDWQDPLLPSHLKNTETSKTLPENMRMLGDIVVSLDDTLLNAEKIGQPLAKEFCFLLVHGLLHLCGHDHMDKREEAVMLAEQKYLMTQLSQTTEGPSLWEDCITLKKVLTS